MDKINIEKLRPETINTLRDMAVKMEKHNLNISYELMSIAHAARPSGNFIRKKYEEYKNELVTLTKEQLKLKEKIDFGELAIIPIGFRCHTKMKFRNKVGVSQESLIFDSGFFPPSSIVSIFKEPKVNLQYGDNSQCVCIKYEHHEEPKFGKGIKFQKSSYDEINSIVSCRELKNINRYLDSTFGYYTLDTRHNFVLAHYNWHEFASKEKSKGIIDPKINLQNINDILNRRIERMFDKCHKAKDIFFIHMEDQGYNYMMIDNYKLDLHDFNEVLAITNNIFEAKVHLIDVNQVNDAEELLNML